MDLKNRLCDVETNRRDPPNQVTPLATTVRGTYVPVEEPSTASFPDIYDVAARTLRFDPKSRSTTRSMSRNLILTIATPA